MTIALIPVKRLSDSKSRLLSELPDASREALTLAMLEDLIEVLSATPGIDRIGVTTPDPTVAARAREAGAEVLIREPPGLNAALEDGRERLAPAAGEAFLIVLGDVAGALADDFATLLRAATDAEGVWLAPSSDGGTSALLQRPAFAIPCRFGPDSAKRHREAASAADVPFHEVALRSLAIDLDQPEDLDAFLRTEGGGRRTRALLEASFGRDRDGEGR
jgi:2-phospho-L-lactate guanylyltransferase